MIKLLLSVFLIIIFSVSSSSAVVLCYVSFNQASVNPVYQIRRTLAGGTTQSISSGNIAIDSTDQSVYFRSSFDGLGNILLLDCSYATDCCISGKNFVNMYVLKRSLYPSCGCDLHYSDYPSFLYYHFSDTYLNESLLYHGASPPIPFYDFDCDGFDPYNSPVDCNNCNWSIKPSAIEICGNGIDEDCSGQDLACSQFNPDWGASSASMTKDKGFNLLMKGKKMRGAGGYERKP